MREKRNPMRENFQKNKFSPRENKKSTREKNLKCTREKFRLPVKIYKKVCVKTIFHAWKNSKIGPKMVSRTLLIFT